MRELESMSREIVNLKEIIGKPSEKNIVTNLPQKNQPRQRQLPVVRERLEEEELRWSCEGNGGAD